ncbi:MAG TPA: hypothetical protein DCS67_07805 [Clostridiales bacterium UBA8960]|nr:hypothetical protein [Clostridiales bacterium UBA8960]
MNYITYILNELAYYAKNDWYIILIGILIAASMKVFVDPEKLKEKLLKHSKVAIPASVGLGAFTPLCACGTMAVVLSLFLTNMPWGAVMAFLISSPLTSPAEFFFEGSFMGWKFATAMMVASIMMGLIAGYLATLLEKKTAFFEGQFRLKDKPTETPSVRIDSNMHESLFSIAEAAPVKVPYEKTKAFLFEIWNTGVKKIMLYFIIFIIIGKTVEYVLPMNWEMPFLTEDSLLSVVIGSTVGLPLYVNYASALPLLKTMVNSGVSEAAILAFLIAGKATGIPVIAGMAAFLRKRALAYYVLFIWISAIIAGYIYTLL